MDFEPIIQSLRVDIHNLLPILRNTSIGNNNAKTTGNFLYCTSCCLGIGGWIELDDMNTGIYGC